MDNYERIILDNYYHAISDFNLHFGAKDYTKLSQKKKVAYSYFQGKMLALNQLVNQLELDKKFDEYEKTQRLEIVL